MKYTKLGQTGLEVSNQTSPTLTMIFFLVRTGTIRILM